MSGETFDIDLTAQGFSIFGPRRSGKSWLLKTILDSTDHHLVYDPMREHDGYHHYRPDDRESIPEYVDVITKIVIPYRPALFVTDEANKYIENHKPLPEGVNDLIDFCGHWGISVGFVARRMTQVNTSLVELADTVFFFRLTGRNDYQYLEDLQRGLGDQVRDLPKYHFVVWRDGEAVTHAPIPEPKNPKHTGRK